MKKPARYPLHQIPKERLVYKKDGKRWILCSPDGRIALQAECDTGYGFYTIGELRAAHKAESELLNHCVAVLHGLAQSVPLERLGL